MVISCEGMNYDTYGSERSWSPVEEVTVKRGDCRVSREACTPATRSDKGRMANMEERETTRQLELLVWSVVVKP